MGRPCTMLIGLMLLRVMGPQSKPMALGPAHAAAEEAAEGTLAPMVKSSEEKVASLSKDV
jgi:hypothetical protein